MDELQHLERPLLVANWKLYRNFQETVEWCFEQKEKLIELSKKVNLIICPEITSLATVAQILDETGIGLGGQFCSPYEEGAYTGAISARSLYQVGCSACLVGHTEHSLLTDSVNMGTIAMLLIINDIIPIICIGEKHGGPLTFDKLKPLLEKQLLTVSTHVAPRHDMHASVPLCIAYEPAWAIGTDTTADESLLNEVASWLQEWGSIHLPHTPLFTLYGGGISSKFHISQAKKAGFDGLLIGHASLDIQNLEKIVS